MPNNIDRKLAELLTDANIDSLRYASGQWGDIEYKIRALLKEVRKALINADIRTKRDAEKLIREVSKIINQGYGAISAEQMLALEALVPIASKSTAAAVNTAIGAKLLKQPKRIALKAADVLIQGAPSTDWWASQAYTVQKRFAQVVRTGIARGLTVEQMARAVVGRGPSDESLPGEGVLDVALRDSRSLVHSSVQAILGAGRRALYQSNSDIVIGTRQVSTLDSHTTIQCQVRDGLEWTLDGKPVGHKVPYNGGVPVHWGCRSIESPVLKPIEINGVKLQGFRGSQRASTDGPVSSDLNFEQWLEGKSKSFQEEVLGKGRAELWREGRITFADLLDLRGTPLTLKQLREKYE